MEESLIKSNFVGRDGFRWWVGQIAPIKVWKKNTTDPTNGWGFRYKVRIMGYHPANNIELKDEDLPWAQTLLPTTAGTGAGGYATKVQLQEGDVVFGFFLDGDDAQVPVIMGAFGRTPYIVSQKEGRFKTFSPTNELIKAPDAVTSAIQNSQVVSGGPNSVPNPTNKDKTRVNGVNEVGLSDATGNKILLGTKKPSTLDKISNALDEFLAEYKKYSDAISKGIEWGKEWLKQEIDFRVEQLEKIVTPMVEGAIKGVMDQLVKLIKEIGRAHV